MGVNRYFSGLGPIRVLLAVINVMIALYPVLPIIKKILEGYCGERNENGT